MSDQSRLLLSRRQVLKYGGLTAAATAAAALGPRLVGTILQPGRALAVDRPPDLKLVGTDGWIYLPGPQINSSAYGVVHPDSYAPAGRTDYIFGFANGTGVPDPDLHLLKNTAQHSAPMFWAKEGEEFRVQLTNVGLAQRPDLFDAHTVHWHGFKNVIPFFDGEPTGSVSVPQGQTFTYVYKSHDPGTYMFHCHVEDVEHVHMGMTGLVFVRPAQDHEGNSAGAPVAWYGANRAPGAIKPPGIPLGYAYNDSVGLDHPASTAFDREYGMFLSELWAVAHWADAHIQLPEWSDYHADYAMLNGRVWPDTLAPNGGSIDPFNVARNGDKTLVAPAGHPELGSQPISSLVQCNAGERVLLRFANLGFKEAAMTLTGIKMRTIGHDATFLRGREAVNPTYSSFETNTLSFGAGESYDAIFTAPAYSGSHGPGGYDTYILYNRMFERVDNTGGGGGQRTEVRVYAPGTVPDQNYPNG